VGFVEGFRQPAPDLDGSFLQSPDFIIEPNEQANKSN
jgi:hypothetical protein